MNCKHSPPPESKSNVVQFLKTEWQACQRPLLSAELAIHTGDPNPTAKAMKHKGNRTRHSRYRFGRFPILEINTTARALKTFSTYALWLLSESCCRSTWKKRKIKLEVLLYTYSKISREKVGGGIAPPSAETCRLSARIGRDVFLSSAPAASLYSLFLQPRARWLLCCWKPAG